MLNLTNLPPKDVLVHLKGEKAGSYFDQEVSVYVDGEGFGYKFVTELPEKGEKGLEYIVMNDVTNPNTFRGSYVWNDEAQDYVVTSGAGGGALDSYSFEKTTSGWVALKNGNTIFTYNDERILQNTVEINNIENDIYGNYLLDRISVCPNSVLSLEVDDTNPKQKKLILCSSAEEKKVQTHGAYRTVGVLSTALLGITPVPVADVVDLVPDNILAGKTYLYDANGTVAVVTNYDETTKIVTVCTMTIAPTEIQGVRLGAVDTSSDLPSTTAQAVALNWRTPVPGDFAYVRDDGGKLAQYIVSKVEGGNITWTFAYYLNGGDYVVDILTSSGIVIPKAADGSVTLPPATDVFNILLADGTLLPKDANRQVKLADFGLIKTIKDYDGNVLTIEADGSVRLPEIPDKFKTYAVDLSTHDIASRIDEIITIPTSDIIKINREGMTITIDMMNQNANRNRDLFYIHGLNDGQVTQEAIGWYLGGNADGFQLQVLVIPRMGEGGSSSITDKQVPRYTKDLHVGDVVGFLELITYGNVLYRAKENVTITGVWADDEDKFDAINIANQEIYYNTERQGQELGSLFAVLNTQTTYPAGATLPFEKVSGNMTLADGMVTIAPKKRVEITCVMQYYASPSNTAVDINYVIKDLTNNVVIARFNPLTGNNYHGSGSQTCQYTNESDEQVIIGIQVETVTANKQTWKDLHCTLNIHEVGRVVDPIAYLNNAGGTEDTPVGNVISYLGKDIPKHYLACDGTLYNLGTYVELEAFITAQFGTVNYFGGDGVKTWAVPDLRGEFLRGTGSNSHKNNGNGASVGTHQNATAMPQLAMGTGIDRLFSPTRVGVSEFDTQYVNNTTPGTTDKRIWAGGWSLVDGTSPTVTIRPTNTSVNYCIKYEATPCITYAEKIDGNELANIMMKPNLWPVGVEQAFGDGVYGYRYQIASVVQNQTYKTPLTGLNPNSFKFINQGGQVVRIGDNAPHCATAYGGPFFWVTGGTLAIFTTGSGNYPAKNLDLWCLYTK